MRFFKNNIGLIAAIVAVVWSIVAIWLSANQFISPYREGIGWSYLLAIIGSVYHSGRLISRPLRTLNVVLAIAIPIASLTIIRFASRHSNEMFAYWKLRSVSKAQWQTMSAELNRLSTLEWSDDIPTISPKDLPSSFSYLGPRTESVGITIWRWDDLGVTANVMYGGRYRTWGMATGPTDRLIAGYRSATYRFFSVGTNANFFVGWGG
jgi:hypothetical protein